MTQRARRRKAASLRCTQTMPLCHARRNGGDSLKYPFTRRPPPLGCRRAGHTSARRRADSRPNGVNCVPDAECCPRSDPMIGEPVPENDPAKTEPAPVAPPLVADAGGPMRRIAGWVGALLAGAMARIVILLGATIVLARFLTPTEFGLASLITSIVVLLTVFAGGDAFEEALAQRRVLRKIHLQAVIGYSWLFTTLIIAVAIVLGVVVGPLFDEPAFWPLFAFGCVSIYANSITTTATAMVRRQKRFKVIARGELIGAALGSAGAIGLAALGAGPWAVVALRVIMVSAVAVNLALASRVLVLPRLKFAPIRELLRFSSFSLGQRLATDGSYMVLNYVVASFFSVAAVGYFSMALRLTDPMRGVARSVSHNIAFSFFRSRVGQFNFTEVFLNTLAVVSLLAFPAFLGIAAVAGLFIEVVVGAGWEESVPIVRALAIGSAIIIPLDLVATALNARGFPAHLFTQRMVGLGAMLVTLAGSVVAGLSGLGAGIARAVGDVAEAGYAMRALGKSLDMGPLAPLKALAPQFVAAVAMALAVDTAVCGHARLCTRCGGSGGRCRRGGRGLCRAGGGAVGAGARLAAAGAFRAIAAEDVEDQGKARSARAGRSGCKGWVVLFAVAGVTGLEPATSGVTGRHSNQLSYTPATERRRSDGR